MTSSPSPSGSPSGSAAPRRLSRQVPPRPDLPDEKPELPHGVVKELRRQVGDEDLAREVILALSVGAAAIDEGYPQLAVDYLSWARHHAPRSGSVREALGVALYHAGDYRQARTELQAYRRLTGRDDQNHVLADCERARGGAGVPARVAALVEAMEGDDGVDASRRVEGRIVWASALADEGELVAARAVLRREVDDVTATPSDADLRLLYVAADLAARDDDHGRARALFDRIVAADPDFLDAADR